jgi:hypothetical protein
MHGQTSFGPSFLKRKKKIQYRGPNPIRIICHLQSPPNFSLVPTFKTCRQRRPLKQPYSCETVPLKSRSESSCLVLAQCGEVLARLIFGPPATKLRPEGWKHYPIIKILYYTVECNDFNIFIVQTRKRKQNLYWFTF